MNLFIFISMCIYRPITIDTSKTTLIISNKNNNNNNNRNKNRKKQLLLTNDDDIDNDRDNGNNNSLTDVINNNNNKKKNKKMIDDDNKMNNSISTNDNTNTNNKSECVSVNTINISTDQEINIKNNYNTIELLHENYYAGGQLRANRAAKTIQYAYRQYKLRKNYIKICENTSLKRRSLDMENLNKITANLNNSLLQQEQQQQILSIDKNRTTTTTTTTATYIHNNKLKSTSESSLLKQTPIDIASANFENLIENYDEEKSEINNNTKLLLETAFLNSDAELNADNKINSSSNNNTNNTTDNTINSSNKNCNDNSNTSTSTITNTNTSVSSSSDNTTDSTDTASNSINKMLINSATPSNSCSSVHSVYSNSTSSSSSGVSSSNDSNKQSVLSLINSDQQSKGLMGSSIETANTPLSNCDSDMMINNNDNSPLESSPKDEQIKTKLSTLSDRKYLIGINLFNRKPSMGVKYLMETHHLDVTPQSVARFLLRSKLLSRQMIGEYISSTKDNFTKLVLK